MDIRIGGGLLWGRATVVGLLAYGLGVLGHVTADGLLPSPVLMVAMAAGSVLFSVPMLARPASTGRMLGLVVGAQAATHLFLTVTAGHAGDPVRHVAPSLGGYQPSLPTVDGRRVGSLFDAYRGAVEPAHSNAPVLPIGHLVNDLSAHAPMVVAHLVASVLVGLWLAHGERCLISFLALSADRLLATVPAAVIPAVDVTRLAAVADRVPDAPRGSWLARPRSRRGPPLLVLA